MDVIHPKKEMYTISNTRFLDVDVCQIETDSTSLLSGVKYKSEVE